ncbi:MAG: hypothetical protein QM772_02235 [Ottowia sp.]|uniref:restriction endonuclease n=1 Tax=Ottowia sp. TaxID=1898956 RepID=UPI0039E45B62
MAQRRAELLALIRQTVPEVASDNQIDLERLKDAYDCVLSDSDVESRFAQDCSNDERVRFFFKLPGKFRIDTPLGTYNPDWAVVFENDARVYFVAETKSSTVEADRLRDENLKIECGRRHFALAQDVECKVATSLQELTAP